MTDNDPPDYLPAHHSPVRALWAQGHNEPYEAFHDLAAARAHPDGAVIMEGDCGGQIYLTCPVRHIHCSQEAIGQLLVDLNGLCWGDGEGLFYEALAVGSGVGGGMGGGVVVDGLWLHPKLEDMGLHETVEAVLAGRLQRIEIPPEAPLASAGAARSHEIKSPVHLVDPSQRPAVSRTPARITCPAADRLGLNLRMHSVFGSVHDAPRAH